MSLRDKISSWLLDKIISEKYKVGNKIPSEYELAELFKVNKTTANKAVGDLVLKGYLRRCRGAAGTIVINDKVFPRGHIGFLLELGSISCFSMLLVGAQQCAFSRGYTLQYFGYDSSLSYHNVVDSIVSSGISGLLVSHLNKIIRELPTPVIYINDLPNESCSSVVVDNFSGGQMIGRYLADLGHRKTAFVRQSRTAILLKRRYMGYCDAMAEVEARPLSYVFESGFSRIDMLWKKINQQMPDVTAIACDGDNVAFKFYQYLTKIGVKVPEEISLTGFSYLREVQSIISLTSVFDNPVENGYHGTDLLIDQIENRSFEKLHELMPVELKIGMTTSPPQKH